MLLFLRARFAVHPNFYFRSLAEIPFQLEVARAFKTLVSFLAGKFNFGGVRQDLEIRRDLTFPRGYVNSVGACPFGIATGSASGRGEDEQQCSSNDCFHGVSILLGCGG